MADIRGTQADIDRIRDQERLRKQQQDEVARQRQKVMADTMIKSTNIGML